MKKQITINNLKEFLDHLGAETPYQAGRSLYKYTGCGPWTAFITNEAPATTQAFAVTISACRGGLRAEIEEDIIDYPPEVLGGVLSFLGFDQVEGVPFIGRARKWKSLKAFRARASTFFKKMTEEGWKHTGGLRATIGPHQHSGVMSRRHVFVAVTRYADSVEGSVYYEDKAANEDIPNCIGIKVGSIVEGSEADVDREPLYFPFTGDEFDKLVKGIDDEAGFYWKRDNLDTFIVESKSGTHWFDYGWGEPLPKDMPCSLRKKVEAFLADVDPCSLDEETPIPDTKATIVRVDKSDFIY